MASRVLLATSLLLTTAACGSPPETDRSARTSEKTTTAALPSGAEERLKPGLWEQSGMNGAAGHAARRCVTPEEAQSANGSYDQIRAALAAQATKDGCKIGTVRIDGPVIAFTQTCSGTAISVSTTYRGTSSTTEMSGVGIPARTSEGRRVGGC